jgi:hypothetical protein
MRCFYEMSGNKWVYVILIAILFFSLLAMPTAGTSAEEVYTLVTLWPEFPQLWYFDKPYGIAVDGSGDVFVADVEKNQIQKVEIYQVAFSFTFHPGIPKVITSVPETPALAYLYSSKPDLIIQFIRWSPSSPDKGDTIQFAVKIKNQGSGSAGSSTVKYYIDGSYVGSDSVSKLPAGTNSGETQWQMQIMRSQKQRKGITMEPRR